MKKIKLDTVEEAIEAIRNGEFVVVVDDEDRENEGDLIIAADSVTIEKVNFMEKYARGLICAPMAGKRCDELDLPMMVTNNTATHATPFTVSVDLLEGCTTGISAHDRAMTILALANPNTKPGALGRPGHIFPLRAHDKGVLSRIGHTEAAVDLAVMAGKQPVGVLIEIKNNDGEMSRLPELREFADQHGLKLISIADMVKYRLERESLIEKGTEVNLPTAHGEFHCIPFRQVESGVEHMALIKGTWRRDEPVLVRVHSSCMTGDIFGSQRCECGEQLAKSMQMIEKAGKGAIVYLNQEGRGIGLMAKMAAYKLQEEGMDTVDANLHLGYKADERTYGVGAAILRALGISKMKLMSNNPVKRIGIESFGLEVVENVPIEVEPNKYNSLYMKTKKERMGHNLHNIK